MDPNTGKVYSEAEVSSLPPEVQERLVPVPQPEVQEDGPGPNRRQRRHRGSKVVKKTYKDISQQRRKNKQARKSRKINRK